MCKRRSLGCLTACCSSWRSDMWESLMQVRCLVHRVDVQHISRAHNVVLAQHFDGACLFHSLDQAQWGRYFGTHQLMGKCCCSQHVCHMAGGPYNRTEACGIPHGKASLV